MLFVRSKHQGQEESRHGLVATMQKSHNSVIVSLFPAAYSCYVPEMCKCRSKSEM